MPATTETTFLLSDTERNLLLKVRKGATTNFKTRQWEMVLKLLGLSFDVQKEGREIVKVVVMTPQGAMMAIKKENHCRVMTFSWSQELPEKDEHGFYKSRRWTIPSWCAANGYPLEVLASQRLGMETPEQEKARKNYKARDWTNTGTCGVCERNIKMGEVQKLVHHGYERPGDGSIRGDCFGVGYLPHEVSPEAANAFLEQCLKPRRTALQRRLADLREGRVAQLCTRAPSLFNEWKAEYVKPGEVGWELRLEQEISAVEQNLRWVESEIERFMKKVAAWVLDELPEVRFAKLYGGKA